MSEFDVIRRHFQWSAPAEGLRLGIGDDAALVAPSPGQELAIAVDTLVAGVHFPADTPPAAIGHKALAVNLSDLAAMGAVPRWFTLALTLPQADPDWLAAFAGGLRTLAGASNIALIGGDTTRGPLCVSVQVIGEVPAGQALRRDRARAGDRILVSGHLGDAALALALDISADDLEPDRRTLRGRLDRPLPRLALGQALRGLATAAIDISDGLLADLGHILTASGLGAGLEVDRLPASPAFRAQSGGWPGDPRDLQLAGGDDYELLCCLPATRLDEARARARALGLGLTEIGALVSRPGLRCVDGAGRPYRTGRRGWDHFGDVDGA